MVLLEWNALVIESSFESFIIYSSIIRDFAPDATLSLTRPTPPAPSRRHPHSMHGAANEPVFVFLPSGSCVINTT